MYSPKEILKKYWGYDAFRPLQEDIVNATLKGEDVLALLPTGGGKSICFQVPALCKGGVCIVVSPLIALMKDQVEQLQKRGIKAVALYSGMHPKQIDIALDNAIYGNISFVYVSPERLQTELFIERVQKMNVSLIAVDEAHCISQWGYDFRPPYLEIAAFREQFEGVNMIAVTATATPEVQVDIIDKLKFNTPSKFQKSFARENLAYVVRHVEHKKSKLLEILTKTKGSAVVYARNRKHTKEIAQFLIEHQISADYYHAGLSSDNRTQKQARWIKNEVRVIVATNAFGMGIDKPDVRLVVHMDLPDSIEAYFQEAGRAGRDLRKAYAVILLQPSDPETLIEKSKKSYPEVTYIRHIYQCLINYFQLAFGSSGGRSYDFEIFAFTSRFNLDMVEAFRALKLLEETGYIMLSDAYYHPSVLHCSMNQSELYKFQVANANLDPYIKAVLRLYGGALYSHFVTISEKKIANYLEIEENDVAIALNKLNIQGVMAYKPQATKPQLSFTLPIQKASTLGLDQKRIEERRDVIITKAKAMAEYVSSTNRCRSRLLLAYFGEEDSPACGVCDYCDELRRNSQLDENVVADAIIKLLHQRPMLPSQLFLIIPDKNHWQYEQVLKNLLDEEKVYLDGHGKLALKAG